MSSLSIRARLLDKLQSSAEPRPPGLALAHALGLAGWSRGELLPLRSQLETGWSHAALIHSPIQPAGAWIKSAAQACFWFLP